MSDWWLGGVVMACVGGFALFRAARQYRRLGASVAWHACIAVIAFVAAAADFKRDAAMGVGLAALGGLALIGLAAALGPRVEHPWRRAHAPLASRRLRIAAAWSAPLAVVVATLLELAAEFPPVPIAFYVVMLTLVGSWFTDSHTVLSVGLRWVVAIAAAAAFSFVLPQIDADGAGLGSLATSASWLGGAVLLVGSTLVRARIA